MGVRVESQAKLGSPELSTSEESGIALYLSFCITLFNYSAFYFILLEYYFILIRVFT